MYQMLDTQLIYTGITINLYWYKILTEQAHFSI